MPGDDLRVYIGGEHAADIVRSSRGLTLEYTEEYAAGIGPPLSLSLPIAEWRITGRKVEGWMSGLLPGGDDIRARWAAKHGAPSASAFDLLGTRVGLDCAGAVQFSRPENGPPDEQGGIRWLSDQELAEIVEAMISEPARWERRDSYSAFSLPGAQPKTALRREHGDPPRWGETWGKVPTTHILKPSMAGLQGQSINEHLCLAAARYCGIAAARTSIETIAGQPILVVERFDRVPDPEGTIRRIHQEDFHQAAGDPDTPIYQDDQGRGHSIATLALLMATHSADPDADRAAFLAALALNWVLCNTDAHSKNYSLLFAGAAVRLAPLYDVWSVMPYDPDHYAAYTLAMSPVADRRVLGSDNPAAWEDAAVAVGLPRSEGPERAAALAQKIPSSIERAIDELSPKHRADPTVNALATLTASRTRHCLTSLATRPMR